MKERITYAFDDIQADNALLEKTAAYLQQQRNRQYQQRRRPQTLRFVSAMVTMLILVVVGWGHNVYMTPIAYVSVDVNPSIELTLNRLERVISVYAFNEDGEALLQKAEIMGKLYNDAVTILVDKMEEEGYLAEDTLISMTVQTENTVVEQSLQDSLLQAVTIKLDSIQPTSSIEIFPVSSEIHEEAHSCHVSPAKYIAIQELLKVDENATIEQYSSASIGQIRQRIQECQGEHGNGGEKYQKESSGEGGNKGKGQGFGGGHSQGCHDNGN